MRTLGIVLGVAFLAGCAGFQDRWQEADKALSTLGSSPQPSAQEEVARLNAGLEDMEAQEQQYLQTLHEQSKMLKVGMSKSEVKHLLGWIRTEFGSVRVVGPTEAKGYSWEPGKRTTWTYCDFRGTVKKSCVLYRLAHGERRSCCART